MGWQKTAPPLSPFLVCPGRTDCYTLGVCDRGSGPGKEQQLVVVLCENEEETGQEEN